MKTKQEKQITKKIKTFDTKLKTSFILIRQDLDDMQIIITAMRKYLKKKDKEYSLQNSHTINSQTKINTQIEEFTEKTTKLKLAISQISAIKSEVVLRKDLLRIENRIKESLKKETQKNKKEISLLKEKIKFLKKGTTHQPKKSWFKT